MKQFNIDLREEWMGLSTPELEKRLDAELEKQPPDDETVLTLLHILEDREPELPLHISAAEAQVLKRYQQKRRKTGKIYGRWFSVAASVLVVLTLFFAVAPQKAEAETFWEMLQRITSTVLSYLNPADEFGQMDYVFETDNPDLQQIYDAVVELGITEPVVPMWLPEGYVLTELNHFQYPMSDGIHAIFSDEDNAIVYKLNWYAGEPAHQFYKDDAYYETYEWDGVTYNIVRNNNHWLVVWEKENIECFLTLDCQEETLRRILRSIYVTEDD